MRPKAFIALTIVTALITVAAVAAVATRDWGSPTPAEVRPFPELLDKVNAVSEITIRQHDGAITLKRGEDGWRLVEKHDYPVLGDQVSKTVIGIGDLRLTEPKTRKPERHARLGVEDIAAEDAKSKLVALEDSEGKTLAEIIVGRPYAGVGQEGVYVRLPDDDQAWLADAELDIPGAEVGWLQQRIIHVSPKRVARLTTVQPDGEQLVIYKDSPDDEHFMFKDLPEGTVLKGETVADETPSVLFAVDLLDVKPDSEIDFTGDVTRAAVKTFDGLVVEVETTRVEGATWARFSASSASPHDLDPDVAAEADFRSPDEVAAEADEINARVGGWAYQLNEWQADKLTVKLAAFLEGEIVEPPEGMSPFGTF
jgi:hypothetical protein